MHARATQLNEATLGLPEAVVSAATVLRPLAMLCSCLAWVTLLGWWSDPRSPHDQR